jgi:hypothetical protein
MLTDYIQCTKVSGLLIANNWLSPIIIADSFLLSLQLSAIFILAVIDFVIADENFTEFLAIANSNNFINFYYSV